MLAVSFEVPECGTRFKAVFNQLSARHPYAWLSNVIGPSNFFLAVAITLGAWSAAAQTTNPATFTYLGNKLEGCDGTLNWGTGYTPPFNFYNPPPQCVSNTGLSATITFSDVPPGYTGWAPLEQTFTIEANGFTVASGTGDSCLLEPDFGPGLSGFHFVNGALVEWGFQVWSSCGESGLFFSSVYASSGCSNPYVVDTFYNGETSPPLLGDNICNPGTWTQVPTPLQITTTALPSATSGGGYGASLSATGGSDSGYVWSLIAGQLPDGFTLTPSGILSSTGTPAAQSSSYNFTVQVTDSDGNLAAQELTVVVAPPGAGNLSFLNPLAEFSIFVQPPTVLDVPTILTSPTATSLAADGQAAVVVAYQTQSSAPVTFEISVSGIGDVFGTLAEFDPFYPQTVTYPNNPNAQSYQVSTPTSGPDAAGNYTFLALLWAPPSMPAAGVSLATVTASATQPGQTTPAQASIAIEPPPLLLVHGIWSSSNASGFAPGTGGLYDWIAQRYPHNLIYPVDYNIPYAGPPASNQNAKSFADPVTQAIFGNAVNTALAGAAASGMAARAVDVVGHSMGGLVARYYLSTGSTTPGPIHTLITIGTPHQGTPLATALWKDQGYTGAQNPYMNLLCPLCTLGSVWGVIVGTVDTGVQSLEPTASEIGALSLDTPFSAIVGSAPTNPISTTESFLDLIIAPFLPGQTIETLLANAQSDTIVPTASQSQGAQHSYAVPNVVHASICSSFFRANSPCINRLICEGVMTNSSYILMALYTA